MTLRALCPTLQPITAAMPLCVVSNIKHCATSIAGLCGRSAASTPFWLAALIGPDAALEAEVIYLHRTSRRALITARVRTAVSAVPTSRRGEFLGCRHVTAFRTRCIVARHSG